MSITITDAEILKVGTTSKHNMNYVGCGSPLPLRVCIQSPSCRFSGEVASSLPLCYIHLFSAWCGPFEVMQPYAYSRKEPVRFDSFRSRTFRKLLGLVRFGSEVVVSRFDAVRPALFGRFVARSGSVRISDSGRFRS